MFFTRLRRQAKWVFVLLAIVFASSFVLFGVGTGFGGLQDLLTRNSGGGSSGPSLSKSEERVRANPNDAAANRDLAQALQDKGRVDEAVAPLERYVKLRPRDTDALGTLGTLYLDRMQRLGERYSAVQAKSQAETFGSVVAPPLRVGRQTLPPDPITQALTSGTDEEINTVSGQLQAASRKATQAYGKLAALSPTDPRVTLQWAQAAEAAGDYQTAVRAYERFIKISPTDPNVGLVKQRIKLLQRQSQGPVAR